MSRREDVDNAIWVDPDFADLSADAKLLYLWGFTNPHANMAGLYKVARVTMSNETSLTAGRVEKAVAELVTARFWFVNDAWVWVRTRVHHLRSTNPNMATSVAKDLAKLDAADPLRVRFLEKYGGYEWLREKLAPLVAETVGKPFRNGSANGSSEPNVETVGKPL